jgi:predicted pyridoxine 5'-phosphate oxidase superfamily flavin-nucleotide-binding protein
MQKNGAETTASPWHEGELQLQRSMGVVEQMDPVGRRVLRPFLPDQHRAFYPLLPFIVIGAVDPEDGTPWATLRAGPPGFLQAPNPQTLTAEVCRDPTDPADCGMEDGDPIGLLGIDLFTRRRNRLNGRISRRSDDRFHINVDQSFGNCPRYIQKRQVSFGRDPATPPLFTNVASDGLDETARQIIAATDSFFVASYADRDGAGRQVDVSHRGGKSGFVRLDPDGGFTVPDFNGNLFFNTLGNFVVNPQAGLLFVDPTRGGLLQVTGRVEIILESPEIAAFEGAERLWRVRPTKVVWRPDTLPLRWSFVGPSQKMDPHRLT